jgi:hypothetical protein
MHRRLAGFVGDRYGLAPAEAAGAAYAVVARAVHPAFTRALFGVEPARTAQPEPSAIAADVDLAPIRAAVAATLPGAG